MEFNGRRPATVNPKGTAQRDDRAAGRRSIAMTCSVRVGFLPLSFHPFSVLFMVFENCQLLATFLALKPIIEYSPTNNTISA